MDPNELPAEREERRLRGVDARLARLAARRGAVMTAPQLRAAGFSSSAISRRIDVTLTRLFRGVVLYGLREPTDEELRRAALLAAGTGAVLGARSARAWWRLGDDGAAIEVIVPRRRRDQPGLVTIERRLSRADWTHRRGLPVTSVARTAVDLAGAASLDELKRYVHEAECSKRFRLRAFEETIARAGAFRGKPRLLDALAVHRPLKGKVVSGKERLFHAFLADRGYPPTEHNALIHLGGDAWVSLDVYFPEYRLAVEIDSAVHDSAEARIRDAARDREVAAVLGVMTLRVRDTEIVTRPDEIDRQLRAALAQRAGITARP